MASFCGRQDAIMQTLRAAKSHAASTNSLPIPSFMSYLELFASSLKTEKEHEEMKRLRKAFEATGAVLPGLQKAAGQYHRYSHPPAVQVTIPDRFDERQAMLEEISHKGHAYFFEKVVPFLIDRALEWPQLFPDGKLPLAQFNPNITRREETKMQLTRRQILTVHALCFLGCDPKFEKPRGDVGSLSWWSLFFSGTARVGVERILCQLMYFEYWRDRFEKEHLALTDVDHNDSDDKVDASSSPGHHANPNHQGPNIDEVVTFIRVSYPEGDSSPAQTSADSSSVSLGNRLPNWYDLDSPLFQRPLLQVPSPLKQQQQQNEEAIVNSNNNEDDSNSSDYPTDLFYGKEISRHGIDIEGKFMEDFECAGALVDFANEQLMIGRLIPSMTQEEVMFSVRPELLISLLLFDTMRPHEAVIMRNARVFMNYRGYRDSFQVHELMISSLKEPTTIKNAPEIVAIDSHVNWSASGKRQFQVEMNTRDLDKCWIGFSACENEVIATGPWGCGAFACSKDLKFLQQLIVAATCGASQPSAHDNNTNTNRRKYLAYHERDVEPYRLLSEIILQKKVTVSTALRWIDEFSKMETAGGRVANLTSSDAPPPIQLGLGGTSGGGGDRSGLIKSMEDLRTEVKEMMNDGGVQRNSFLYFMFQKLVQ